MTHEMLIDIWFVLIGVLWTGYFFLEGFDFGVGVLLPFLGRDDADRRVLIGSVGPVWDGNEVWLLVAGGATFAAFPGWYATLFSGFYLALLLILAALILRNVAFEFRGKLASARWRRWWDRALFFGSLIPALLWGVAFSDVLHGVPIGASGEYVGTFFDLLQPYALLGGATFLVLFVLHGSLFLALKTEDAMADRARRVASRLWPLTLLAALAFLTWTYGDRAAGMPLEVVSLVAPTGVLVALGAAAWLTRQGRVGWAFTATGASIVLLTATIFVYLFPRVLVSSLGSSLSLTVDGTASGAYTLGVMTVVALIFTPLVLAYQGWTYWVFRKRVGRSSLVGGY